MVLGCSNGAEAYSIASVLSRRFPDMPFAIAAYDLKNDLVEQGRTARYSESEVIGSMAPAGFVEETFVRCADGFIVRPQIAHRVQFDTADVLDERLRERVGAADIVFAQNLMINFQRDAARKAFHNVCDVLDSRAALFVDGMDVDLRARLTRDRGLVPLDFMIREIHEDARKIRGSAWPWIYWGLEPFMDRPDAKRRYATVFLKG
jgi:chemotaxis methyl-accepting protein methylase